MNGNGRIALTTLLFVMATFAADMYSVLNSSPQTTEINAATRANTLMKWVYIGDGVALGGGVIAWIMTGHFEAFLGSAGVVVMMHLLYVHAKNSGLASSEPGTETYGTSFFPKRG